MKVSPRDFLKIYWPYYFWGILCLLFTNLMAANIPLQVKQVIDRLTHHQAEHAVGTLIWIGVIITGMFIVRVISRYCLIGVGRRIEFDVRMNLYRHLLGMPRSFFDEQQTGELMSRLTNDLTALRMFLGGGVMLLVNVAFAYLIILPFMAMLSWRLTLFAFLLYPIVVTTMRFLSRRVKALSHEVQDRLGELTAVAQENFSGISVIQSYVKEPEESRRFYDASRQYFEANTQLVKSRALLYILIAMVSGFSILVVVGEGGREVIVKDITLSSFAAFMLYLERLSWPTVSFGWILSTFQQGRAAIERINEIFQYQPTITDRLADPALKVIPSGSIMVKNLSFRYDRPYAETPDDTEKPLILRNLSFEIKPGELVALVGPIGSGKTTLLHLLVRLYETPENTIYINDIAIERYPLEVLRHEMTLMPQSTFLFSATIFENIAYVDPNLPLDDVTPMAQVAQIHSEIMTFPKTYQTVVGERGVTLSGGQRQRSTLARTLLMAPQILLLDDPFSNVDSETEETIIQALFERKLLKHKTTVFASQRFALVRRADKIIVLDESGRIDAIGTHDDLIQTSALYQSLNKHDTDDVADNEVLLS